MLNIFGSFIIDFEDKVVNVAMHIASYVYTFTMLL